MIEILKSLTMEEIQSIFVALLVSVGALVSFLELVVRFTPTKKDDGFIKRVGAKVDYLMDLLKVPNRKIKDE
jgi:hypothetical protein